MTRISVVIPARDAAATIGRTLDALRDQTQPPLEVVVVDDGSSDDTATIAARRGARVIANPGRGPAAARNAGTEAAAGELIAFTDADCFPAPDWIEAAVRALAGADLVQGAVRPERPPGPFERTLWVERESGLWESANLLARREALEALGGFEEWIEPRIGKSFGEDLWLGIRVRRAGLRTAFDPGARVEHAVFARGPAGYVGEFRRLRYFPAAVALMPELRSTFLHGRVFLSPATRDFDLALAGLGLAAARRSPLPLVAGLPWARRLAARSLPHGRRAPLVAAAEVAAQVVGAWSLLLGSARHRRPVL